MDAQDNPPGFYFSLTLNGDEAAFQEISGLDGVAKEAGSNESPDIYKHSLPLATQYGNLVIKRGIMHSGSKLANWISDTISADISSSVKTHDIIVKLVDSQGQAIKQWEFKNAYPVKCSSGGFTEKDIAIETLEFAYSSMSQ